MSNQQQPLFDIGINFISKQFQNGIVNSVIEDSQKNGVKFMIGISNSTHEIHPNKELCERYSGLYYTAGIHPHRVKKLSKAKFARFENFLAKEIANPNTKLVALGECGLDYNRCFSTPEKQRPWFEKQLDLAMKFNLPLYLHCRDAHNDFVKILSLPRFNFRGRAVVHCFTGSWKEMKQYLDMGFSIGITGWICDQVRSTDLTEAIQQACNNPDYKSKFMKSLMIETDSPWLTPKGLKPRPNFNTPDKIIHVLRKLSELTGEDEQKLREIVLKNSCRFFGVSVGIDNGTNKKKTKTFKPELTETFPNLSKNKHIEENQTLLGGSWATPGRLLERLKSK